MAGEFGFGTQFKVTVNTVLTAVADLTSISGPDMSADEVDFTSHDSLGGYREFGQGLKDGGSVELEGNFYSDTTQENLIDVFDSGDTVAMEIVFPNGLGKWTFDGFVTAFSTDAPHDDKLSFTATVKITGKPELVAGS